MKLTGAQNPSPNGIRSFPGLPGKSKLREEEIEPPFVSSPLGQGGKRGTRLGENLHEGNRLPPLEFRVFSTGQGARESRTFPRLEGSLVERASLGNGQVPGEIESREFREGFINDSESAEGGTSLETCP